VRSLPLAALWTGTVLAAGAPADPAALSGSDVKERWATRLDGRHFTSVVRLTVTASDKEEIRELVVWRDDEKGANERLMARFESPPYLRGFALLYLEAPHGPHDYFVYQPELDRVRRVSREIARQDVYGVDLEFLGFGLAQQEPTEVESLELVELGGTPAYRLVEEARASNPRFERRITHLDRASFVPLRTEHLRAGKSVLVATSEEIGVVQGIPTPLRVRFERPPEGSEVVMAVRSVDYESPIPATFFSTLALLKRP
jgi:hypothetical protein